MKKVLFVLFVLVSTTMWSQEKTAFQKDTYKLVKRIVEPSFKPLISRFLSMVKPDKEQSFSKDINALLPELYNDMTKIYMQEFTYKDIKVLLAFYNSPIGKKLLKKTPILTQKGMQVGQQWGMKLQGIMAKYK